MQSRNLFLKMPWFSIIYQYTLICIYFQKNSMKCKKDTNIKEIWDILNTISQENRLQIICLLNKHGELCVCKIMEALDLKQNLVSHHLWLLKKLWILESRKEGKNIYYSLDEKWYKVFTKWLKTIFKI